MQDRVSRYREGETIKKSKTFYDLCTKERGRKKENKFVPYRNGLSETSHERELVFCVLGPIPQHGNRKEFQVGIDENAKNIFFS